MNYFELFAIPVSLKVDKSPLAKKYFELQKQYHPDFFTQSDEAAQKEALETSSIINKALKVLQQPDATIQYVLQLKGLLEENEKYNLPPDFLMDMMDLNEKLTEEASEVFKESVNQIETDIYNEVKNIIETYNNEAITMENLQKVKEYYFKKKYLQRILDRMDD